MPTVPCVLPSYTPESTRAPDAEKAALNSDQEMFLKKVLETDGRAQEGPEGTQDPGESNE